MSKEQLASRLLSIEGKIAGNKLRRGHLDPEEWGKLTEASEAFANSKLYIDDTAGITVNEMKAKVRRLGGVSLVVIDYLQLVTTGNKRVESRQVEVSEISRSLKTMALELGVPVIALSQLSRSAEKRESNMPMLADLRESGSIEQDADIVLFINRKDYYEAKKDQKEKIVPAELVIAKHRKGSLGTIDLLFELNMSAFRNVAREGKEEY